MQTLTHVLKLCSVILQFLGIFDMARLYVIHWAFIFPRHTKFQEKKILSGCFKFHDLNLGLAEAIEILKATAQKFGKSEIAAFWNIENSLYYFTMFLIDCTWVELLLPHKDGFGPQCHLPLYLSPHQPVLFSMLKFSMALVSYFLCSNIFTGFPIFWFWIFRFWIFEKTSDCLFMFLLRVRKGPANVNFGKSLCSRIFWSSAL